MNPVWLAKYPIINQAFMEFGWAVAPYMTGGDLHLVEETADYIVAYPPKTEDDRKDIEERIYRCLSEPVYHTGYRARATWYGNQLKHLKPFNHLYESAIFSYYKREYIQSVLCLLCTLEGVMLSFYRYNIGSSSRKPSIRDLIYKIKMTVSHAGSPLGQAHDMYRDALSTFLERWIYKDTGQSDLSLSVLNRHYVLHGMDAGNFYRSHDLHRLIITFDLLIEFMSFHQNLFYIFLPDFGSDPFIDSRRAYYEALAFGKPTVLQSWHIERELLKDHIRYVPPSHDPNMEESLPASKAFFEDLIQLAAKRSGLK